MVRRKDASNDWGEDGELEEDSILPSVIGGAEGGAEEGRGGEAHLGEEEGEEGGVRGTAGEVEKADTD